MPKISIKNPKTQNGLVVVSAKEHGKIYEIKNGELSLLDYVAEHPPQYSDNEGFFMRSGHGEQYGTGYPKEIDDARNLERYLKAIATELSELVQQYEPQRIFIIEPIHYKHKIREYLKNPSHIPTSLVTYGNYVEHSIQEIAKLLEGYKNDSFDPADPASVQDEENAEEKRKLLAVGQLRQQK